MKINILYLLTLLFMVSSCAQKSENPEKWSPKELDNWYTAGNWKSGWNVNPDESIDKKEFALQFQKNPERWEKAFNYLKSTDLETVSTGRYELDGTNLYVIVDEYTTRNLEDSKFEAHRKYADIQYVVHGKENMGITPLGNTKEMIPYDNTKDIVFLTTENYNDYRKATPDRFFMFFPSDAHCPGVKDTDNEKVRKIVVKVRLGEE